MSRPRFAGAALFHGGLSLSTIAGMDRSPNSLAQPRGRLWVNPSDGVVRSPSPRCARSESVKKASSS